MMSKDTQVQIAKLAVEAITGNTAAKKPFLDRANQAVRKLIRDAIRENECLLMQSQWTHTLNERKINTAAAAIFNAAVDFELGPKPWWKQKPPKAKAGTELDLFRKAAAKAKAAPKAKGKKTAKKAAKAAALIISAAALIFSAGIAAAQCPGGNCQAAAGYYYPAWIGWYWPGFYYGYQQQARANCPGGNCPAQKNAQEAPETPADGAEFNPDEIPEWEPESAEGAPEGQETAPAPESDPEDLTAEEIREAITPPPCPLAALAIRAVNDARRARGLAELIPDENLSAACERHSAYMKARGFGHAADGGRECIAENYATPAATVSAWLNSPSHAAIILGAGTRIGIGVVGRFYTLRIR